jgi:hypothetical protein
MVSSDLASEQLP